MRNLLIAAIGLALSMAIPAAALETALFVDGDGVRLRSQPSLESSVLGKLHRGDEVRIRSADGQWREVWVPKSRQVGWVAHWLLAQVPPEGNRRDIAYVDADRLNLRTGPGEAHGRKGILERGTQVDVIAYHEQWRKIRVPSNGEFGWVAGWHLKSTGSGGSSKPSYYGEHRWVGADRLNLRTNPSTGGEPMAVLLEGHKVYLMSMQGEWVKIRVEDGPIGWVHRDYLKTERPHGADGGLLGGDREADPDSTWGAPRWVGVDELYLRPGPDTENKPMAILTRGKKVYLMYLQEEWAQVHVHGGDIGWVFRDYLKQDPIEGYGGSIVAVTERQEEESYDTRLDSLIDSMSDDQAIVTKQGCNIRQGPGTGFSVIMKAGQYDRLTVHGQASGWLKITTAGGQQGWIASWLCSTRVEPPALPASEVPQPPSRAVVAGQGDPLGMGKRIAELALGQIGRPYVWGAESPSSGFDCSGLVYWSHGEVGIKMMRTTWDQWDDPRGKAVPTESLQPGDVVCFANTYRRGVSHVGIYIGDGEFVHAPGRGKPVRIDTLSSRSRSYCGARRFY
ncbi:MAG: SH3 domain-containing protein [Armatimonadia bacterium]|nr:SH3 domain-containing protein [Armatimonadia bacterium]